MALGTQHEIHTSRFGRNMGVALELLAFVALVFGLTVVKVNNGGMIEAFDHQPQLSLIPENNQ